MSIKKQIVIVVISALIAGLLTVPVRAITNPPEVTETHIILLAKDADTEIELTVDGKHKGVQYLQPGINYLAYQTDSKPDVSVLTYGDTLTLKMTEGKGRDWYTFARIMPPEDGDGERYE